METGFELSDEITIQVISVLKDCYDHRPVKGLIYVTQTGLRRVSKLLGGDYRRLSKRQRKEFVSNCTNTSSNNWNRYGGCEVKTWSYYINLR